MGNRDSNTSKKRIFAEREALFTEAFGSHFDVDQDSADAGHRIDIYIFDPVPDSRDFFTVISSGMSDYSMPAPSRSAMKRVELVLYLDEVTEHEIALLRHLAKIPVSQGAWFGSGSTLNNGTPPQPYFEGSKLDHLLFLPTIISPDSEMTENFSLAGDPTGLLWPVFITSAEWKFIQKYDVNRFLQLMDKKNHPFILDRGRKSFV